MRTARRRLALTLAAALVLVGGAIAAVLVLRENDPPALRGAPEARSAAEFVDSVGVNVHVTYYDTAYARFDEWTEKLGELGVRHVRDGLITGDPRYVERYRWLAELGHRATLIVDEGEGSARESVALAAGPLRESVAALEGPNELDIRTPDWEAVIRRFMPELSREVDAQLGGDVPLLGPSFVNADSRPRLDDIEELWDVESFHPYPGGQAPFPLHEQMPAEGRRPSMATETGYHNALEAVDGQPPVSEEAAAVYAPRLLAENFAAGIQRTFLYELLDEKPDPAGLDPEQHFGLLRQDLTPKPAYHSLRNLLRTVSASPGEGSGRDVKVENGPDDLGGLLLEREDGSSALLLWRRASAWDVESRKPIDQAALPVVLRFAGEARDIEVSYPSRGGRSIERTEGERVDVRVGADVVVVSFR